MKRLFEREANLGYYSDYFTPADDWLKENKNETEAWIEYMRVSNPAQAEGFGYRWQDWSVNDFRRKKKIGLLDYYEEQCHGGGTDKDSRPELYKAIRLAKAHQVPIIAASACRFLRPFKVTDQSDRPTKKQFDDLMQLADGVPLLTLLEPDMDWEDIKSFQAKTVKRFQRAESSRANRKKFLKPVILEWTDMRVCPDQIVRLLCSRYRMEVSDTSIRNWLKIYRTEL